jgi:hypothetical protein
MSKKSIILERVTQSLPVFGRVEKYLDNTAMMFSSKRQIENIENADMREVPQLNKECNSACDLAASTL